jgi:hypothetical protein
MRQASQTTLPIPWVLPGKLPLKDVPDLPADVEGAWGEVGMQALAGERKSLPSLLMVSRDLAKVLNERYSNETQTLDYLDQLKAFTPAAAHHS